MTHLKEGPADSSIPQGGKVRSPLSPILKPALCSLGGEGAGGRGKGTVMIPGNSDAAGLGTELVVLSEAREAGAQSFRRRSKGDRIEGAVFLAITFQEAASPASCPWRADQPREHREAVLAVTPLGNGRTGQRAKASSLGTHLLSSPIQIP